MIIFLYRRLDPREAQNRDKALHILSEVDQFTIQSSMRTLISQTINFARNSKPYSHSERPQIDISINKRSKIESELLAQEATILWIAKPNSKSQHLLGARTLSPDSSTKNCKVQIKSSMSTMKEISGLMRNKEDSLKLQLMWITITRFQDLEPTIQTVISLR